MIRINVESIWCENAFAMENSDEDWRWNEMRILQFLSVCVFSTFILFFWIEYEKNSTFKWIRSLSKIVAF